ncbi:MAG: DUF3817 domain-containing protein [Verrucomicrobiales bacterium]
MQRKNPIQFLRRITFVEAVSFLVLLFIAMPLKYLAAQPMAVRYVGWCHGILFILFCGALLRAHLAAKWPLAWTAGLFIAGLLPFVPFFLDHRLRKWESEFDSGVG